MQWVNIKGGWYYLKAEKFDVQLSILCADHEQSLAQMLGLLGQTRMANNLNQLAHKANCGSLLLDEQTE